MTVEYYQRREDVTITGAGHASYVRVIATKPQERKVDRPELPLVLKFSDNRGGYAEAVVRSRHGKVIEQAATDAKINEGMFRVTEVGDGSSTVLFSRTGYQEMCSRTGAIVINDRRKSLDGFVFLPVDELLWIVNSKKIAIRMDSSNPKYEDAKAQLTADGIGFTEDVSGLKISGINKVSAALELGASFRNSSVLLQINGSFSKAV